MRRSFFSYLLFAVIIFSVLGLLIKSNAILGSSNAISSSALSIGTNDIWQNLSSQLEKAKESLKSLLDEIAGRKQTEEAPSYPAASSPQISSEVLPETISQSGQNEYAPATEHEAAIINIVKKSSPAVVSVVIYKNMPLMEQYFDDSDDLFQDIPQEFRPFFEFKIPRYRQKGTEKMQVGGGSGFIIRADGLILTNKHVASDENAEYAVVTNDNKEYKAVVLARDPVQDLAILKIQGSALPILTLGNSDKNVIGQTVIAIGNALGEFRNTVSVGVISGLGRSVKAGGSGMASEIIEGAIQTDAAINQGNSGGPLLNLRGEVIGINTAMAFGAENIGFSIPINKAKKSVKSVETKGKISTPYLGVRYQIVNGALKEKNNLPVDYGAWIQKGQNKEPAVASGSAADKAGLKEGDIILELDAKKISADSTLASLIQNRNVGDTITLKIIRGNQIMDLKAVLGEL